MVQIGHVGKEDPVASLCPQLLYLDAMSFRQPFPPLLKLCIIGLSLSEEQFQALAACPSLQRLDSWGWLPDGVDALRCILPNLKSLAWSVLTEQFEGDLLRFVESNSASEQPLEMEARFRSLTTFLYLRRSMLRLNTLCIDTSQGVEDAFKPLAPLHPGAGAGSCTWNIKHLILKVSRLRKFDLGQFQGLESLTLMTDCSFDGPMVLDSRQLGTLKYCSVTVHGTQIQLQGDWAFENGHVSHGKRPLCSSNFLWPTVHQKCW